MRVLARKINRAKWQPSEALGTGEIPADALSSDLRTSSNALSFWACESANLEDVRNAFLALATAAERVDKIDLVWVEEGVLPKNGIATARTLGNTKVKSLAETHVDLIRLDVHRLGRVAELVADAIKEDNHRRLTRREVVDVVVQAIQDGLVAVEDLSEGVRSEVEKVMA